MRKSIARTSGLLCLVMSLCGGAAYGQTVFLLKPGGDEGNPPSTITAKGGDTLELIAWVDEISSPGLEEWRITMPCSASGGDAGSIDHDGGAPTVDSGDADYVFYGITHVTTQGGSGSCPSSDPADMPFARRGVGLGNGPEHTSPTHMVKFIYEVSSDARGSFQLTPAITTCHGVGSYLVKDEKGRPCFSETFETLTINVPIGRCCINEGCSISCEDDNVTHAACDSMNGVFSAELDCTEECLCQTNSHCDDGNQCTQNKCTDGVCSNPTPRPYGDVGPCGGDGAFNFADVSFLVNLFQNPNLCQTCECAEECDPGDEDPEDPPCEGLQCPELIVASVPNEVTTSPGLARIFHQLL